VSRRGLQYRVDAGAQGIEPVRRLDAWALRHPMVDNLAGVILAVGLAVLCTVVLQAWWGALIGFALGALFIVRIKANHRRRIANGTSAAYGRPTRSLD